MSHTCHGHWELVSDALNSIIIDHFACLYQTLKTECLTVLAYLVTWSKYEAILSICPREYMYPVAGVAMETTMTVD